MVNLEDIHFLLGESSIFLTGFMGSGKTSIGHALSEILEIPFYDIDYLAEKQQGIMVIDIFRKEGEDAFRQMETEILQAVLEEPGPNVISLGGGTLESEINRSLIRNKGILIGLKSNPHQLIPRLNEGQLATLMMMTNRPLYDSLFTENIAAAIEELYERRKDIYEDVDISVESGSQEMEEIIEEILFQLSNKLIN